MSIRTARLILILGWMGLVAPAFAADDDRERAAMERFKAVLERSPRRGTALDRVYGYHVERGELDGLIRSYRDRTARDPKDGDAWLLLGLLEAQRGRDAAAVAAFRPAEAGKPADALTSYYLGQSLVLVGQPDEAVEAFERAITRKPSRTDLLEIFQALGRVHQRARRDDKAMAVWTRLEAIFPDDPRVQEQIAATLAEEGKLEPALARSEALAKSSRDPYRKVRFGLEAADLKVKLGRQGDALRDYEGTLAGLDPASWLSAEVRRKIEDVFLRDDDQVGLAKYYEGRLARVPDDLDAMTRLARTLVAQGRSADARVWLDKALKLAPSNRGLRLALIDQLSRDRQFAEAASQYEALAKNEPNNPDIIRDWGRSLLRDPSRPEADRKAAAVQVWKTLVDARPDDAPTLAQVADLCRQAGLVDEALSLFQKAIALAPASPQYREYLGEYYHKLKRPADALAAWRGVADGPGRSAASLERLGEVLAGFGYKDEAIAALDRAIGLEPASYPLRIRQAGLLLDGKRFDAAEAQLIAAGPLADDAEKREELIGKRIGLDEASGRLPARVDALRADVAGSKAGDAATWLTLARYAEAARRVVEATRAAEKAAALDGTSISARSTLARLYEATGRLGEAADSARALATLDRRARAEHLTDVARLEARLGRKAEALEAGREVLAAAPGNPEVLQTFADLCVQLGEPDQAIDALRRAVRADESDPKATINLAEILAREFRTEEAIEAYWKAFERSTDLDARLGQVAKLAELYLRRNQFDRLVARLERLQGEDGRRREGTFLLSQAYASLGDFASARRQLEGLLDADARDTALLKQLAKLAEDEGDNLAALKYQQQLNEAAPGREAERRVAELAVKAGQVDVAEAIWARTLDANRDFVQVFSALSSLVRSGRYEIVLATTNRLLRSDPANWEALYLEARTLKALGRPEEAAGRHRAILDLRRDDDEQTALLKALGKGMGKGMGGSAAAAASIASTGVRSRSLMATSSARYVSGLAPGAPATLAGALAPRDFGEARVLALAHELARARQSGAEAEWVASRRQAADRKPADSRAAWDNLYVAYLLDDPRQVYQAARDLVRALGHDLNTDAAFLESLPNRTGPPLPVAARLEEGPDRTPPLPPDEVDLVRDALKEALRARSPALTGAVIEAATLELKRAGRLGEIDAEYRAIVDSATDHPSYTLAGWVASERGDVAGLRKLAGAFDRLPMVSRAASANSTQAWYVPSPQGGTTLFPEYYMGRAIKVLADAKRYGEILGLVDFELALMESPARVARRSKPGQSSPTATIVRNSYPVFTTSRAVSQLLDYPTPTPHLEAASILLLRGAFALLKRDDRAGDLVAHLRQVADASAKGSAGERDARLALSAALWWSDDRDGAARALARAVELTPGDIDLVILTAEARSNLRQFDEALAAVDSIETVDQDATRRRELLALRLAVQAGRAERARQAAERLFGLRLDSPTQLQLAAQMHQLGMHDLADAVLGRARRQLGQNSSALLELMAQYRRQGNLDAASQIAIDVLRRSSGQTLRVGYVEDASQKQAIDVLAASGKLDEMIAKAESQVKTAPGSLPLRQALAAYYRAAGRLDRLRETHEAILKLRPEDTSLRIQVATQLAQAGDLDAALGHYRAVFQNDPGMIASYATVIFTTFQQANRLDELTGLVERIGLKAIDAPNLIQNMVLAMLADPKTIDRGADLLGKAVDSWPAYRLTLLNAIATVGPFWERADAYAIAKRGLLPAEGTTATPWAGLGETIQLVGYLQDGKLANLSTRLLAVSHRLGTLDDLAGAIEASLARQPGWLAGKAILALVRLRQGRADEGRSALEAILADPATVPPYAALIILGQETRDLPATRPLAIALYERASRGTTALSMASLFMKSSPPWNLAMLHRDAGRPGVALAIARQAEEGMKGLASAAGGINAPFSAYRRVGSLSGMGQLYLELGDHADALRLADEFFTSADEVDQARGMDYRIGYPPLDALVASARETARRALDGLTPETLAPTLEMLVKPGDPSRSVDLRLVIFPREVDRAEVRSLLDAALGLAGRDRAMASKLKVDLDAIAQSRPGDLEARVAIALLAEPDALGPIAASLGRLADDAPLPPITTGGKPDAKTRDEAARRLGLWFVARRCWEQDSTAEIGDKLATVSLDAARRLSDSGWAVAMLRELGRRALDRGDRAGAEVRFAAILALIEQDPLAPSPSAPAPNRPAPAPAPNRPAPPGRGAPRPARSMVPSFTLGRFRQAAEFAGLAAEAGLADLSLKAVRDALKGGTPVLPVPMATTPQTTMRITATGAPVESPPDPVIALVAAKLVELDASWTKAKVEPSAAYETLRDAVMPPARPTELFLYDPELTRADRPPSADATSRPGEVARLLARRARAAGRVDDLRAKLDERKNSPAARDAARRILAAIEEAAKDR